MGTLYLLLNSAVNLKPLLKKSIKKEILKKKKKKEILSVLPIPGNRFPFYCLHNTAFSRMSNSWNHTVYDLFRLASFTW